MLPLASKSTTVLSKLSSASRAIPSCPPRTSLSSSVPVKTTLADVFQTSGSLTSLDDSNLLADEGGDVDAALLCDSVGGRLTFQPFETFRDFDALSNEDVKKDEREEVSPKTALESWEETCHGFSIGESSSGGRTPTNSNQSSLLDGSDSSNLSRPNRLSPGPSRVLPDSRLPHPVAFDLVDARIFREGPTNHRFVLYTIAVRPLLPAKSHDRGALTLEKRFSDFDRLHAALKRRVPVAVADVNLPPKRLFKNFDARTIAERSRAFEQYLGHVCAIDAVRATSEYSNFFYGADLFGGMDFLSRGLLVEALPSLHRSFTMASLVVGAGHRHAFLILCCLTACYDALDEDAAALEHALAAVEWLRGFGDETAVDGEISPWERRKRKGKNDPEREDDSCVFHDGFTYNILTVPLIENAISLSWKMGRDKRDLEKSLKKIRELIGFVNDKKTLIEALRNLRDEFH